MPIIASAATVLVVVVVILSLSVLILLSLNEYRDDTDSSLAFLLQFLPVSRSWPCRACLLLWILRQPRFPCPKGVNIARREQSKLKLITVTGFCRPTTCPLSDASLSSCRLSRSFASASLPLKCALSAQIYSSRRLTTSRLANPSIHLVVYVAHF